jgi:molybdopterin-dependent oxidoreductase alpha subunit
MAKQSGGLLKFYKAMRTNNACKTCALGMGGQNGGMVNEAGRFPEVCKKSFQAMAADMQGKIEPEFFQRYSFADLRSLSPRELESAGRITQPLLRKPGAHCYEPINWSDAIARITDKLNATAPDESFFYFSGRSSNEAGFLLQLVARIFGTNNVNNCSYYCHQASGVGLSQSIGTGTATIVLDDVEHADLYVLVGGNPASNHPRLMRSLMEIRRRGGNIIVINPAKEIGLVNFSVPSDIRSLLFSSPIASEYVQPHIGGDIALLTAIAKALIETARIDQDFIRDHTDGAEEYFAHVRAQTWPDLEQKSGVDRAAVERLADLYAAAKNTIFGWTMGITHHQHGVENVQAIVNLALLRGQIGRPHAGLMPIRGHSNVQGIGSVGVTPKLKDAVFDRLKSTYNLNLPTTAGLDTMDCMTAADAGRMRFALCLGGNLYGSNPDATFAQRALNKIDTVVYLSTTLNTGHAHGTGKETIILPVLARDEEPQTTTQESMFNYVRLSDGGDPRHDGPRAEVEVISDIAAGVLPPAGPIDFDALRQHKNIRKMIAAVIPGYEAIADIDHSRKEFHIAGRTIHAPIFPTTTGKAQFKTFPVPALRGAADQLRLMTVRSEGQFNTVVYEEHDLYRGQDRRDVILMNPKDIDRLNLRPDQPVTVTSDVGSMPNIRVRPFDITPGNAMMYYPEANAIVPAQTDPQSKTPNFKSILIRIEPAQPK